jgi:hypothetical protein
MADHEYQANMLRALARSVTAMKIASDNLEEQLAKVPRWRFVRRRALERQLAGTRLRERSYLEQIGGRPSADAR